MQKGEFIGAAVVPNIIHHVYGGDKSRLLDPSLNTYRLLPYYCGVFVFLQGLSLVFSFVCVPLFYN